MLDSTSASAAIKLLAFGPNPALQKVLQFDGPLGLGGVNRATGQDQYVGGKGQGVALALHRWAPGSSSIAHFLGGDTGTYVSDSMGQAGVHQLTQPCAAPTRVCTTLLDDGGRSTELIEPSGTISPAELDGLLTQLTVLDEYSGIAFCGTTPPGASALYAEAAARCGRNTLLMVDAFKEADVRAVLDSGRVDVLKLNVDEVKVLTSAATADEAAASLLRGPEAPLRRPGALLALTDGPKSASLFSATSTWRLQVPTVECVNAIGAGDVCTAVFLHSLAAAAQRGSHDGEAAADAFAWGLAAACARCTHQKPSEFTREEVEGMRAKVSIERA